MSISEKPDSTELTPFYSLFGLDTARRKLELPPGVTIDALRARIDSIRSARK